VGKDYTGVHTANDAQNTSEWKSGEDVHEWQNDKESMPSAPELITELRKTKHHQQ